MSIDYESVWGTERNWKPVDLEKTHVCMAALVGSWIAMVASFVFIVFTILTRSEVASILMIAAMLAWMGCGITYIRIRRNIRKNVQVIE
jgi:hypothetical protein